MSLAEEARRVRERIAERLRELEPMAREYEELKGLAADMGIEPGEAAEATVEQSPDHAPPAGTRRRRSGSHAAQDNRRDQPQRPQSGRRQAGTAAGGDLTGRVLAAVRSEPGKTVGEYATILGVSQTALYRPVRELTNDRVIVKRARQLFPG